MKRLMPSQLKTFLANNPVCHRADCFAIALPTGQVLCVTDGQWDITFTTATPGWLGALTTFYATKYGNWQRGSITSEAGFKCSANSMDLTLIAQPGTTYPGTSLGILNATLNHLLDGATVWVWTAYMPLGQYGNVSNGVMPKFQGTICKWSQMGRTGVKFDCADPLYLCNLKVPARLFQSNCAWSMCDANCSLSAANYTVPFAAGTATQTTLGTLTQPDGYFAQGVVTCVTGQNAGLSQTVKSYAAGVLTTMVPWLLPVAPGDTFTVIKGCDKTPTTCAATTHADGTAESQNWQIRFGGDPFIPPASTGI